MKQTEDKLTFNFSAVDFGNEIYGGGNPHLCSKCVPYENGERKNVAKNWKI